MNVSKHLCLLVRDQEVGGSNPLAPTNIISEIRGARVAPLSVCYRFATTLPDGRAINVWRKFAATKKKDLSSTMCGRPLLRRMPVPH